MFDVLFVGATIGLPRTVGDACPYRICSLSWVLSVGEGSPLPPCFAQCYIRLPPGGGSRASGWRSPRDKRWCACFKKSNKFLVARSPSGVSAASSLPEGAFLLVNISLSVVLHKASPWQRRWQPKADGGGEPLYKTNFFSSSTASGPPSPLGKAFWIYAL